MRRLIHEVARLFRVGQMPGSLRVHIDREGGPLWLEEGIPVTAILQGFKAPGVFCGYRRMSFIGFAVLTKRRLIVSARFFNKTSVDVAYGDPLFRAITFSVVRRQLSLSFDADGIIPDASGEVTLRLSVLDLPGVTRILAEKGNLNFGEQPVQDGSANGSQPIRSETNRTSSEAGFRR